MLVRRKLSPLLLLGLAVGLVGLSSGPGEAARRLPNIIFIMADDLGWGGIGSYGQQKIKTPNLDRLAKQGMRFTQAYAGSHVCAPSRSVLMTGLHTGHTPVRANGKNRHLYDADVTVAEVLKRAGYATGGFGKWGLGKEDTPGVATRQGFDEWFGQYSQVHAHFYYPYWLWKNETRYPLPGNEGGKREQYAHDEIHRHALDFIRRKKDGPFFAYLPYIIPHVELVVPEDSEREYRGQFPKRALPDPRPGYLGSEDGFTTYAGMVSRLDRHVGEVTDLLKELKIDRNTIVIFTSDNGPQGDRAWDPLVEFFDGNGPYRGSKGHFYEGGLRVPFIVHWPGVTQPGSVSKHPLAFWDVMPTLAQIAGVKAPPNDGISFVPALRGSDGQRTHAHFYWEYPYGQGVGQAVRRGDWKGVIPRPGAPLELYNLKKDPSETTNVVADRPKEAARIRALMESERTPEREYGEEIPRLGIRDFVH